MQRLTADERRAQILEAALDEFADKGFNGARTREIARRAGISETLIYQHFENKEALYRAAFAHLYSEHPMREEMHASMAQEDDEALLYAMALHMLQHTREDPRIVRLHLYSVLDEQPDLTDHGQGTDESEVLLADYIGRRVREGIFAPCNPVFAARLFHYMVFMAIVDRQLGLLGTPLEMKDEELARTLSKSFLYGHLSR